MIMKRVLVDMDGVLADIYPHMVEYEYKESGIKVDVQSLTGRLEEEAFPSFKQFIQGKQFFRTAPVVKDSVEGLKYLNGKYDVMIVSSATEFPDSLIEKYDWLGEHFPFISWRQMIFCGSKQGIRGDIMIDDHIKNLNVFEGQKILFTQPHNLQVNDEKLERVYSWKEIISLL